MNNSHKVSSKAIALFLSLGVMTSLAGCEAGDRDEGVEGSEGEIPVEQPIEQDEGGEGGEDG